MPVSASSPPFHRGQTDIAACRKLNRLPNTAPEQTLFPGAPLPANAGTRRMSRAIGVANTPGISACFFTLRRRAIQRKPLPPSSVARYSENRLPQSEWRAPRDTAFPKASTPQSATHNIVYLTKVGLASRVARTAISTFFLSLLIEFWNSSESGSNKVCFPARRNQW